jgi:hypothetical protein
MQPCLAQSTDKFGNFGISCKKKGNWKRHVIFQSSTELMVFYKRLSRYRDDPNAYENDKNLQTSSAVKLLTCLRAFVLCFVKQKGQIWGKQGTGSKLFCAKTDMYAATLV